MGLLRLGICVGGVYAAFLLWAIAQEKLSTRFPSTIPPSSTASASSTGDPFPSPLFLNYAQALASCLSSTTYLVLKSRRSSSRGQSLWQILGGDWLKARPARVPGLVPAVPVVVPTSTAGTTVLKAPTEVKANGARARKAGGTSGEPGAEGRSTELQQDESKDDRRIPWRQTLPALLLQVSLFQTTAAPIGFLALRHISFPTMVLGKSCKLIPVMLLNVLLYRRRFSTHKYVVVALVTVGISIFMLFAPAKAGKGVKEDSAWGLGLLVFNLFIDGLTNSTQDQIFALFPGYSGHNLMLHMSLLAQTLLLPAILLPLPSNPLAVLSYLPAPLHVPLLGSSGAGAGTVYPPLALAPPAALTSLRFLATHPTARAPLLAYALLGGLGQLFIFETIAHFGTLTLTMVTVTRKLFTMLLSVLVFEHKLEWGQWVGVGVVFAGVGVEAGIKRLDVMRKARRDA